MKTLEGMEAYFRHSMREYSHARHDYSFKCQPHKMVKHTLTICWQQPTNCLGVSDHFLKLALKGLRPRVTYLMEFFSKNSQRG